MSNLRCSRDDNRDFSLIQSLSGGEADFNKLMRLGSQFAIAAEVFGGKETSSPVLIPTMSQDLEEQFKLTHKVIDVLDPATRKNCATLVRYNVEKPKSSYNQVQFFAKKKEEKKFEQYVHVNFTLEEFTYLLDVMDSVYDKVVANKLFCDVLKKVILTIYSL